MRSRDSRVSLLFATREAGDEHKGTGVSPCGRSDNIDKAADGGDRTLTRSAAVYDGYI
jgi:hypothetical protein